MATIRVPEPGCYVPAITFFNPSNDTLALAAQAKYYQYLASTGIKGLVVLGTNAETLLLTRSERKTLLEIARASVPKGFPIIAGVSGHSTAQVKEYISDAYEAGANYALVLPCAYFGKQTTPDVVKSFFLDVARTSALPIILYNFPAVCNGLDLDSEIITDLVRSSSSSSLSSLPSSSPAAANNNQKINHSNIVGVKLTCGSVAKITRLAATFSASEFAIFGGQADFLVGGLAAGSAGCIAAFGNIFPRTIVKIYELWTSSRHDEAYALQQRAALAESPTKAGIANTKYAAAIFTAQKFAGIVDAVELARPRKPYVEPAEAMKKWIVDAMKDLAVEELTLAREQQNHAGVGVRPVEDGHRHSRIDVGDDAPILARL